MSKSFTLSNNNFNGNYAINRLQLLNIESIDINAIYENNLESLSAPVTINYDNNSDSKFENSYTLLYPNPIQTTILQEFRKYFNLVETQIEPDKIDFSITKAMDDEICINKKTKNGLAKIIINDDGVVVFTFNAFANTDEKDEFTPLYVHDRNSFDYERFCYTFLSK
jgi:hypothetical protein